MSQVQLVVGGVAVMEGKLMWAQRSMLQVEPSVSPQADLLLRSRLCMATHVTVLWLNVNTTRWIIKIWIHAVVYVVFQLKWMQRPLACSALCIMTKRTCSMWLQQKTNRLIKQPWQKRATQCHSSTKSIWQLIACLALLPQYHMHHTTNVSYVVNSRHTHCLLRTI